MMKKIIIICLGGILANSGYAVQYLYIQNQTVQIFNTKQPQISNTSVSPNTAGEANGYYNENSSNMINEDHFRLPNNDD